MLLILAKKPESKSESTLKTSSSSNEIKGSTKKFHQKQPRNHVEKPSGYFHPQLSRQILLRKRGSSASRVPFRSFDSFIKERMGVLISSLLNSIDTRDKMQNRNASTRFSFIKDDADPRKAPTQNAQPRVVSKRSQHSSSRAFSRR